MATLKQIEAGLRELARLTGHTGRVNRAMEESKKPAEPEENEKEK